MTIYKCLHCRGYVNRFEPKSGLWLVHTIKGEVLQHWTRTQKNKWARLACGLYVWMETYED